MPRKPRSQRRGGGGGGGGGATSNNKNNKNSLDSIDENPDYLSESHTIATLHSRASLDDEYSNNINILLEDDDWADSAPPSDAQFQAAELLQAQLVDALAKCNVEDFMTEKRSAKREALLKSWFQALTQYANVTVSEATILAKLDDLLRACRQALRSTFPKEQYAACRVVESLSILVASEEIHEQMETHLTRMVASAHRAVPVRVAGLRALGMAVLVGVEDDQISEGTLDFCEALMHSEYRGNPVPPTLRATAMQVWTVLATTIHELYIAGKDDVSTGRGLCILPILLEALEQTEDSGLRFAAGECVAYIHSARLTLGWMEQDNTTTTATNTARQEQEQERSNTTQKQYQLGSWEGSEWEDVMGEIEAVMEALSHQSGHHMSKKAKKEQRANFREYLATLQDNEHPTEVIQLQGGTTTLELDTWKDIVSLQFVRRCLQGGFQMQLLTNPVLQTMFGLSLQPGGGQGLSSLEKRLYLSKTSEAAKVKDIDLTKKRDKRNNIKNHFLTADGDDI